MDTSHLLENVAQEATHGKGVERIREEGTVPLTALAQSLEYGRPSKTLAIGPFQYFPSWRPGKSSFHSVFDWLLLCWTSSRGPSFGIVFTNSSVDPQPGPFRNGESQFPLLIESISSFFGVSLLLPILQTENLDSPCLEQVVAFQKETDSSEPHQVSNPI